MHDDISFVQRAAIGLCGLVLVASVGTLGIKAAQDVYADVYTLKANFPRSGQSLDSFATVKIRGVTVGSVGSIKLLRDGQAQVTMHIRGATRVPDTASASGEPLSVFGPKFIRLEPGAHEGVGPYLRGGDTITNTQPPAEVTDLVTGLSKLFDSLDPHELATVVHTTAEATDGLGAELHRTVGNAAKVVGVLDAHAADTSRTLADLSALSSSLAAKGVALTDAARDISPVLGVVGARSDQLGRLLDDTSRLSSDLAALVNGHAPAVHHIVDGASSAVAAIYDQLAHVPEFLNANALLIGGLGERLLAYNLPDGHWIGVIRGPASTDPCFLLFGFPGCPPVVREAP
jgi:phospholipid/cholesterol/gamma-HCH transport system substrate-binding protein